jgi:hypothetical protein
MRILSAAALLLLSAAPIAAQALPDWDMNERCGSRYRGEPNRLTRGYCLTSEQEAYDRLKLVWSDVDARTREICAKGAERSPSHNYTNLFECVAPYIGQERIRNAAPFQR